MIERPTTLVLGAGSSVHVGYPLGAELISSICTERRSEPVKLPAKFSEAEVQHFIQRLSRSGHYSIDAYLGDSGDQMALGKYLIAAELKRLEEINNLFPPRNSGWYQYLFNQLLVDGRPDFGKNRLSIVTFNYDRSLETYIHTALINRFSMPADEASSILSEIPIIHVHGILGRYPETPYRADVSADDILAISESIKIIHEITDNPDGFSSPEFEAANLLLQASERIFFLGFGFHQDNVERFRFFTPDETSGREIKSTTYGMQSLDYTRLPSTLAPFGISKDAFPHNSANCELFFVRTAYLE